MGNLSYRGVDDNDRSTARAGLPSTWPIVVGISVPTLVLGCIATVIVVSLIAVYLPSKGGGIVAGNPNDGARMFTAVFGTNLASDSTPTITNYNLLAQQFNKKLGYTKNVLGVQLASFGTVSRQNTNGKKKRQTSGQVTCNAAATGPNQSGNNCYSLSIVFYIIKCPITNCMMDDCIKKCERKIESKIQTVLGSAAFSLTIETTQGVLSVSALFNSIGPVVSATCSSPCQNGGTYTGQTTSTCTSQLSDLTCAAPVYSPPVSNNGVCSSQGSCICTSQWTGVTCTTPVCSPPCSNSGTCSGPGTCSCTSQWSGPTCTTPVCSSPCQNGGSCSSPNTCTCTSQWTGATCTTPVCSTPCSNSGTCSSPNSCSCTSQWSGATCTTPVCSSPCQNGGSCTSPNTCTCTSQWTGATCTTFVCSPPCSNNGTCTGPGTCSCTSQWSGTTCTTPVCSSPCRNSGSCIAPNSCACTSQWTGSTCTTPVCSPPCSNSGTCSSPNTCSCTPQWNGTTCTTPVCSPPCQNSGSCVAPNTCACTSDWTGATCIQPAGCICALTPGNINGVPCNTFGCSRGADTGGNCYGGYIYYNGGSSGTTSAPYGIGRPRHAVASSRDPHAAPYNPPCACPVNGGANYASCAAFGNAVGGTAVTAATNCCNFCCGLPSG